jgi:hypothetical protein
MRHVHAVAAMVVLAVLVAVGSVTTVLAEAGADADGFDGDELLSLPIVLGLGLLVIAAVLMYRHGSAPRR